MHTLYSHGDWQESDALHNGSAENHGNSAFQCHLDNSLTISDRVPVVTILFTVLHFENL